MSGHPENLLHVCKKEVVHAAQIYAALWHKIIGTRPRCKIDPHYLSIADALHEYAVSEKTIFAQTFEIHGVPYTLNGYYRPLLHEASFYGAVPILREFNKLEMVIPITPYKPFTWSEPMRLVANLAEEFTIRSYNIDIIPELWGMNVHVPVDHILPLWQYKDFYELAAASQDPENRFSFPPAYFAKK